MVPLSNLRHEDFPKTNPLNGDRQDVTVTQTHKQGRGNTRLKGAGGKSLGGCFVRVLFPKTSFEFLGIGRRESWGQTLTLDIRKPAAQGAGYQGGERRRGKGERETKEKREAKSERETIKETKTDFLSSSVSSVTSVAHDFSVR